MGDKKQDTGKHYRKEYKGVKLDPARIIKVYGVTHPIQCGVVKKSLRAGQGKKTLLEDIRDIQTACDRWIEMLEEDGEI